DAGMLTFSLSRGRRSRRWRLPLALVLLAGFVASAAAEPKRKPGPRRYVELTEIRLAEGVIADESLVIGTLTTQAKAAFAAHPALIATLADAPDPQADPAG